LQETKSLQEAVEERGNKALTSAHLLTLKGKAEMGLVGGLVASIVASFIAVAADDAGLLVTPWFPTVASAFGIAGLPSDVGLLGLTLFVAIGVLWGLVFAFVFRKYSVTEGLAFSGVQLVLTVALLIIVSTPQVGGTLLSLPLLNSLKLVIGLALTYIGFGVVMGYTGKKYAGLP